MTDWIFTRDVIEDVDTIINTRANAGAKGFMTAAEVMCEDLEEYDGYYVSKWEEKYNEEYATLDAFGESKGYAYYDAPCGTNGSDIIANLMEYALELDKEITFEKTSVMNTVYSDAAGCRIEATEFSADGTVVAAKDFVVVYWKGKAYKVNKGVASGYDEKSGEKIMGYDIDTDDLA